MITAAQSHIGTVQTTMARETLMSHSSLTTGNPDFESALCSNKLLLRKKNWTVEDDSKIEIRKR